MSGSPGRANAALHDSAQSESSDQTSPVSSGTRRYRPDSGSATPARSHGSGQAGVSEDRLAAWWWPGLRDRVRMVHRCRCGGLRFVRAEAADQRCGDGRGGGDHDAELAQEVAVNSSGEAVTVER
jgi:hypothetical protein